MPIIASEKTAQENIFHQVFESWKKNLLIYLHRTQEQPEEGF